MSANTVSLPRAHEGPRRSRFAVGRADKNGVVLHSTVSRRSLEHQRDKLENSLAWYERQMKSCDFDTLRGLQAAHSSVTRKLAIVNRQLDETPDPDRDLPSARIMPGTNGGSAPISADVIERHHRAAVPLSADSADRLRDAVAVTPPHLYGDAIATSTLMDIAAQLAKTSEHLRRFAETLAPPESA